MLNLAQTREVVKGRMSAPTYDPASIRLNHAKPLGLNEAYRQLKALGWEAKAPADKPWDVEMHPDGVPLFRLDSATIRRDKTTRFNWIVEINGDAYDVEGGIRQITEFVREQLTRQPAEVIYDRSANEWQARNGKLLATYPAGPEGRRWAQLRALEENHPRLSAAVEEIAARHDHAPALVDRLLRAAQLVIDGNVYSNGRVASASTDDIYNTDWDVCDCPDFEMGQQRAAGLVERGGVDTDLAGWPVCKHVLARHIADFAEVELYDEPIPF